MNQEELKRKMRETKGNCFGEEEKPKNVYSPDFENGYNCGIENAIKLLDLLEE